MRPIIRLSRNLAFLKFLYDLSRPLNHRAMIVRWISNSQRPESRRASREKRERTVCQSRRASSLPRFFCESIARAILAAAVTAKPDL